MTDLGGRDNETVVNKLEDLVIRVGRREADLGGQGLPDLPNAERHVTPKENLAQGGVAILGGAGAGGPGCYEGRRVAGRG